ncbi:Uncharacterized 14.6 kDa protein in sodA1 3'region [Candidatus Magnetomoraceae bacterium gMMP-1]
MKKKILAVDDSSSIRKLVKFSLESRGYVVLAAKDGREALEIIARESYDAVVLDINMPRMDGFEFLEKVRANDKYASIVVIMLTTEGQEEDEKKAMELGAQDYIVKPFKPSELIKIMGKYC